MKEQRTSYFHLLPQCLFVLCPCCCSSLLNTRTCGWWYATTIQIIILILRSWCAPTFALIFYATIPCPLSCVGGRWRVLLPVTGGAAAWLMLYQNRSLITVEQGRGQWLLPAPRTLLCYPSTFIFMYSVSVLPKTNPYSAGIISNSSSRTRSTKGRHMDREWRGRGERVGA